MSEPEDKDQLWSEATLWFARMRSPDAEAFRPEFEEWLARGALHRSYYNRAAEYWVDSGSALSANSVHDTPVNGPDARAAPRRKGRLAALVALSVALVGSTIVWVTQSPDFGRSSEPQASATHAPAAYARFATEAGEHRIVQLADGSAVTLAGGTILQVQFGAAVRRLELERGQARFAVAHEVRPFVVFAGGGSVTAHGTIFDVRVSADRRVSVRLIRGSVDVSLPAAKAASAEPPTRRLQPGETVSFEATAPRAADAPRPASATAAAQSPRDYRDVPLANLLAEANRDAAVPIRMADPAIAQQEISGRFRVDDTAVLAERLALLFDLAVDRSNPAEIVLRHK